MMEELKILRGNAFTVVIPVKAYRADGSEIEDFSLASCSNVVVKVGVNTLKVVSFVADGNNITIEFAGTEALGWYQLEVTGTLNGEKWRFDNEKMLQIVEHSSAVCIPEFSILAEDTYIINGNVQLLQSSGGGGGGGVQSDWDETNTSSLAYIKNKPTIPTALSQLSQDNTHRVVTDAEKATWNGKSDFSGSYNDLTDKPTIPAAQVNADWDAVSGVAEILNKPTLFSGDYNDLSNKPTIPAAQVNSDWNAVSGVAEILNKPTLFSGSYDDLTNKPSLATVATSGSYNDLTNKPSIPSAQVNSDWDAVSGVAQILNKPTIPAAQVNSDWNANSGVAEILNKPTLFSGDYADLTNKPTIPSALSELSDDTTHRLVTDTEKSTWNGKQNALTFDNAPTDNSNNPVKSGGVYNATVTKQEKMIMVSTSQGQVFNLAAPNYYHLFTNPVNTLAITLPTISSVLYVQDIVFGFTTGANPALTFTSSHNIYYADGYEIEANTRYEVNALFNGIDWVVMATKITTS